jgi:hypothetical protein
MTRAERLMPAGIPRYVRIYDNGGPDAPDGTIDRYTAVFTGHYRRSPRQGFSVLGMDENPYSPQGVGQHLEYQELIDRPGTSWPPAIGRNCHLGKRITFSDLPEPCQRAVLSDYRELWRP